MPRARSIAAIACSAFVTGTGVAQQSAHDTDPVARGRYLATAADCSGCHANPATGDSFSGGLPIETPFGRVIAPNITPDPDTGIGKWNDAQFAAALRQGKMPDGSHLYPAMPYPYYTRMSPEDVLDIRAYLRTLEPVRHAVDSNQLPFPFNIRALMGMWNLLYFKEGELMLASARPGQWNRGAYLVEGPGHCQACHTPKTMLGGDDSKQALQGYATQGWFAPNITNDTRLGIGDWSVVDVADYLQKGHNRIAAGSGPMGEEITHSSSQLRRQDVEAIAVYLKDRPGSSSSMTALPANHPVMTAGAAVYRDLCSACHKLDGTGVPYLFPSLAAASSIAAPDPTTLLRVILQGAQSVATAGEPTGPAMPAFGWQLTDEQVAAVATYLRNSWQHAATLVTSGDVRKEREALTAEAKSAASAP